MAIASSAVKDPLPSHPRTANQTGIKEEESFGEKATRAAIKVKIEAIRIFKSFVFAIGFAIVVNGMESISTHLVMAIMTIFSIAVVKYVLKNSRLETLIDKVTHGVLVFFKNTLKPDSSEASKAARKKAEELKTNELIAALPCAFFPHNPLKLETQILANINQQSYVQYTIGENEELEVEILSKKKDQESGAESDLSEEEKLNTLLVLARRYPEIRIIRLPEINSLQSFIPILRTFSRLEKISLTKINLIQYEIISLLERINLTSLELIDCLLVDDTLWDELVKKTTVFEFKDGILKRYSDLKKMQQHFITDLIHDVISCTDKSKKELIREFIKKLSEDSYKKYFPLVHLGVDLDFRLFSETFEVSAEDSEFTPEQLAKSFIQDFYRAGFKIKTLTFPLDLDEAFFVSIAGMPIKCLRINHITDLAVLKNLPYLEELQLDFTEDDIEGLLKEIPANINKIVLKRVFEEESESEPYLTLEKQADQSYSATVHKLSQGLIALLSSLPQLENFKINISELDLHEIGTFQAQKTT